MKTIKSMCTKFAKWFVAVSEMVFIYGIYINIFSEDGAKDGLGGRERKKTVE